MSDHVDGDTPALARDAAAPETCEYCGKPKADHVDEWGRHLACVESIMGTVAYHEAMGGAE